MSKVSSRGSDQFMLRFPDGMRDLIKDEAEKNGRSMNAEIILRLDASLRADALTAGWSEGDIDILAETLAKKLNLQSNRPR